MQNNNISGKILSARQCRYGTGRNDTDTRDTEEEVRIPVQYYFRRVPGWSIASDPLWPYGVGHLSPELLCVTLAGGRTDESPMSPSEFVVVW